MVARDANLTNPLQQFMGQTPGALAADVLNRFSLVLVLERLKESLALFSVLFGIPVRSIFHVVFIENQMVEKLHVPEPQASQLEAR
jgi:hypothetical protein